MPSRDVQLERRVRRTASRSSRPSGRRTASRPTAPSSSVAAGTTRGPRRWSAGASRPHRSRGRPVRRAPGAPRARARASEIETHFVLGQADSREEALALVARFRDGGRRRGGLDGSSTRSGTTSRKRPGQDAGAGDGPDAQPVAALPDPLCRASSVARPSTSRAARSAFGTSCRTSSRCSMPRPRVARAHILEAARHQFERGRRAALVAPARRSGRPHALLRRHGVASVRHRRVRRRDGGRRRSSTRPYRSSRASRCGTTSTTGTPQFASSGEPGVAVRALPPGARACGHAGAPRAPSDGRRRLERRDEPRGREGRGESVWLGWFLVRDDASLRRALRATRRRRRGRVVAQPAEALRSGDRRERLGRCVVPARLPRRRLARSARAQGASAASTRSRSPGPSFRGREARMTEHKPGRSRGARGRRAARRRGRPPRAAALAAVRQLPLHDPGYIARVPTRHSRERRAVHARRDVARVGARRRSATARARSGSSASSIPSSHATTSAESERLPRGALRARRGCLRCAPVGGARRVDLVHRRGRVGPAPGRGGNPGSTSPGGRPLHRPVHPSGMERIRSVDSLRTPVHSRRRRQRGRRGPRHRGSHHRRRSARLEPHPARRERSDHARGSRAARPRGLYALPRGRVAAPRARGMRVAEWRSTWTCTKASRSVRAFASCARSHTAGWRVSGWPSTAPWAWTSW